MHSCLALLLAAAATASAVGSSPRHLLVQRLGVPSPGPLTLPTRVRSLRFRTGAQALPTRTLLAVAGVAGLVTAVLVRTRSVILVGVVTALAGGLARLRILALRRATAAERRSRVIETCDLLAAELRAGLPAGRALTHASLEWPVLEPVAAAARLGGDVPAALRQVAQVPGADAMAAVAAAWQIAERSGAGLASVLDRMVDALRADEAVRREVAAALGPPRATARMLATLPCFGLLLGIGLGGNPVGFLLDTTPGLACLSVGVALALAGLAWVEHLAGTAER
jgi:tight adherence protein B